MEEVSLLSAVFVSKIEHTNIIIQNNNDGVVSISVEQIYVTIMKMAIGQNFCTRLDVLLLNLNQTKLTLCELKLRYLLSFKCFFSLVEWSFGIFGCSNSMQMVVDHKLCVIKKQLSSNRYTQQVFILVLFSILFIEMKQKYILFQIFSALDVESPHCGLTRILFIDKFWWFIDCIARGLHQNTCNCLKHFSPIQNLYSKASEYSL